MKKFELEAFVFKDKDLYEQEIELWLRKDKDARGKYPTKTVPIELTAITSELGNSRRIIKLKRGVESLEMCIVARDLKLVLEDCGFTFVEDVRKQ